MQGLGSQLCDHLVKKVIDHLEKEINPRFEQFERLLKYSSNVKKCKTCNTPYDLYSKNLKMCKIHEAHCVISCGEVWCKPETCNICNKEVCKVSCDYPGCDNNVCVKCTPIDECLCNYCHKHYEENVLKFTNYFHYPNCFTMQIICVRCSLETATCSNCNEECKMTDIADVIDIKKCNIEGHTQCGRAICKNCINSKRIKL
jgi:hypothetical protein